MRDHLVLYINGKRHAVHGRDAFLSLSEYLRRRCNLIGTKIVCSEGDCGACTVLIGRAENPPPSKGWEQPSTVASGDRAQGGSPCEASGGGINALANATTSTAADGAFRIPQSAIRIPYLPIDSCIQFLFQLDGAHVITVEGLDRSGQLTPVQQAMIDCHGSQCGFCTPGFVMSMTGMLEECDELEEETLRTGLTGNLCRCTGYTQIIESGLLCKEAQHERLNELYPPETMLAEFHKLRGEPLQLEAKWFGEPHIAASPATLAGALDFLAAHPTATIVAGATDIGVRINKTGRLPPAILDLNRIPELRGVGIGVEIAMFAGATWTDLLNAIAAAPRVERRGKDNRLRPRLSDLTDSNGDWPAEQSAINRHGSDGLGEFAQIISRFGARQIRNVGTIAGNVVNASPIADSLPFLFVMDALIVIASKDDMRLVNIHDFYHGYKQVDLRPGELVMGVRIPRPTPEDILRLYKISRRRDLDISTLTAAIRLRLSEDDSEVITHAAIALGGVGPTVIRPRRAEQFLLGQPFTEQTMQAAATIAVDEITPITDVRGAADYRRQLVRNIFRKFYHQEAMTNYQMTNDE
jgi:xanthine dehydrogenase small subunit